MIQSISIKNFLLIRDAYLELLDGSVAITGQTGAGKSLFCSALLAREVNFLERII